MTDKQKQKQRYYQKQKEKLNEYNRAYYHAHKDKYREYHKRWYEKNKDYFKGRFEKDSTATTYRRQVLYTVWNNYTDEVVIVDGNVVECAKAMGISEKSFHSIMTRTKQGKTRKWTFEKTLIKEMKEVDR